MKKESKVNQAKYVELNLFPEEIEDHQKNSISSEDMESDTSPDKEYHLTDLFERLSKSTFRSRFHLSKKDKEYIAEKGLATIRKHAEDFVAKRLAPAVIPNDGKQTPMRGHPVFIAQHATGCCCRGCFFKWHHIPAGRQLTGEEQQYAVAVLMAWIEKQVNATAPAVNVKESATAYTMEVAAPGLKKDMVKMNIDKDGYLNVSIENKDEKKEEKKEEHYLRREFSYSSYSQSYALPEDADQEKISAEVSDGVLKIEIPKIAKEEKKDDVKHIEVK